MSVIRKPRSNYYGIVDFTSDLALLNGRDNYQVQVKDVGIFEWLPTGPADGTNIFAGASGFWSKVNDGAVSVSPSYREYFGILRVLGATPTVNELENTIGSPLTFSSVTTGEYLLSFGDELFDTTKVYLNANGGLGGVNNITIYSGGPNSGKIRLLTKDQTNTASNIGGNTVSIHVRVYP
jgi:hypothetical protein